MWHRALRFSETSFAVCLSFGHSALQAKAGFCGPRSCQKLVVRHRPFSTTPLSVIPHHYLSHQNYRRGTAKSSLRMVTNSKAKSEQIPDSKDVEAMLEKGNLIMRKLEEIYPEAPKGFLDHSDAFTLLVAVVLSAQSLDIKVNQITPELFRLGGTPENMRNLGESKIRGIIKQIGLAPQKARNIAKLSADICEKFNGEVPNSFEELESLAGVGHKTASVVMMQAFGKPAFPVDTHIHRLACRWGCGDAKSVVKTEESLKKWFPDPNTWGELHTRIILFGREHCPARSHDMDECPICSFAATEEAQKNNRLFPKKFTAPLVHKNRYSIRDIKSKVEDEDVDYPSQPIKKKRSQGKKAAMESKKENRNISLRKSGRRKGSVPYTDGGPEPLASEEMKPNGMEQPKLSGRKVKTSPEPEATAEVPETSKRSRQSSRSKSNLSGGPETERNLKRRRTSSRLKQKQEEE